MNMRAKETQDMIHNMNAKIKDLEEELHSSNSKSRSGSDSRSRRSRRSRKHKSSRSRRDSRRNSRSISHSSRTKSVVSKDEKKKPINGDRASVVYSQDNRYSMSENSVDAKSKRGASSDS